MKTALIYGSLGAKFFKTRRAVVQMAVGPDRLIAFFYDFGKKVRFLF